MSHPSIVNVGVTPSPVRTHLSGFDQLDRAADGLGALRSGEITTIVGGIGSGRSSYLFRRAAEISSTATGNQVVCVAVVETSALSAVQSTRRFASDEDIAARVRVAQVSSASQLALFVAEVAARGEEPIAVLLDDFGLLDQATTDSEQLVSVVDSLRMGNVADAVARSTGLPFGRFGYDSSAAHIEPPVVVVSSRVREGRTMSTKLLQRSHLAVHMSGAVIKSRQPLLAD